jgi:hypothetical protein
MPEKKQHKSANPAYIAGMRQIRQSNAAGTHLDKRTRRVRTRAAALNQSIQESQNV